MTRLAVVLGVWAVLLSAAAAWRIADELELGTVADGLAGVGTVAALGVSLRLLQDERRRRHHEQRAAALAAVTARIEEWRVPTSRFGEPSTRTESALVIENQGPGAAYEVDVEFVVGAPAFLGDEGLPAHEVLRGERVHITLAFAMGDEYPPVAIVLWRDGSGPRERRLKLLPQQR